MDPGRDVDTPPAARWLAPDTFRGRTAVVTGGGTGSLEALALDGGASLGQNPWMPGERRPGGRGPPRTDGGSA